MRNQIVEKNMGLVYSLAKRYCKPQYPLEDCVQDGMIGLIRAAEDYNESQSRFSTYATYWIRAKIFRAMYRGSARQKCDDLFNGAARIGRGGGPLDIAAKSREPLDEEVEIMLAAMQRLNHNERAVLRGRFGIGCEEKTLQEIADELGLSRQRIQQIEGEAIGALKRAEEYVRGVRKLHAAAHACPARRKYPRELKSDLPRSASGFGWWSSEVSSYAK